MSNASRAVEAIMAAIDGKMVLEVACGDAAFSVEAAKSAAKVCFAGPSADRYAEALSDCGNIEAAQADAAALPFADGAFDTVVIFNGMARLEDVLGPVIAQCRRVVKADGAIYVISTRMMDKFTVEQSLLPALVEAKAGAGHTRRDADGIAIVEIR